MSEAPGGISLQILTGSLAGRRVDFPARRVLVGRAPEADLRFDPEVDREVSSHHAELSPGERGWVLRDLGSTNGTWVNGVQLQGPQILSEEDEVQFGRGGPRTRVLERGGAAPVVVATPPEAEGRREAPAPSGRPAGRGGGSTGLVVGGAVLALGALVVFFVVQRSGRSDWEAERERLTAQVDSLLARESALNAEVEATRQEAADSVAEARAEVEGLRARLQASAARPGDGEVEALRRQLQDAMVQLEQQQLAAALDIDGIRQRVEPAVAMIWSERGDGRVATGTAVSVDGEGTLLTSRHVVAPEDQGQGERVAIQFAGSAQVWLAEVTRLHGEVDLAWVEPQGIVGTVPSLGDINVRADTLAPGSPVAIVGFPLGGRARSAADGSRPRAVVSAGVLVGGDAAELRIRGYGAEGASGSPVVDRDGRLVGLVYGGTEQDGSSILLAVPIRYFTEQR